MPKSKNGRLIMQTSAGEVAVWAPGLDVTLTPVVPDNSGSINVQTLTAKAAPGFHVYLEELGMILEENGFVEHIEFSLDEVGQIVGGAPSLMSRPASSAPHIEIDVPVPDGHVVIAMVSTAGIVQWHLSTTPPGNSRPGRTRGKASSAILASRGRFLLPAHATPEPDKTGGGKLSFGIGSAAGSVIKFLKAKIVNALIGATAGTVMQYIAKKVEALLKEEGLQYFASGYPLMTPAQIMGLKGRRVLLLVHGIFSSIEGCFNDLLANQALIGRLTTVYGDNIIGYNHWTVGKTPFENARDLLKLLPVNAGLDIDIVCHSRGGLVTRAVLEDPQLLPLTQSKVSRVRSAVFVAGANQGSDLASYNNWTGMFNVFSAFASLAGGISLGLIVGVLKAVAHCAMALPSVKALAPDRDDEPNVFLKRLNGCAGVPVDHYCVAHANFEPAGPGVLSVIDPIVDAVFKNKANDLVVPFDGAATFDKYIDCRINLPFGSDTESQGAVYHTVFFRQVSVQQWLQEQLT